MSRLLHAAARGARIQNSYHNWQCGGSEWREANLNMLSGARIHPDDAHLQYGPISTALRFAAQHGWFPDTLSGLMAEEAFKYEAGYVFHPGVGTDHLCMLALVMAEALADEGL